MKGGDIMGEKFVPKGIDPSQIAGTPEWKQRVQAEAAGHFRQEISGLGQKSGSIEAKSAQISSYLVSGTVTQESQSGQVGNSQEQAGNTTG